MNFITLFSGIGAPEAALTPLGWKCLAVAEIEPFPCAVLKHYYPGVPNLGDVTKITEQQIIDLGHIDAAIFGFPCQDLSVAGKREGLKGARSGLFFDAMRIVRWSRARLAIAENVPGLFSSNLGRDFAAVVGEMVGMELDVPGGGWRTGGVVAGPEGICEWVVLDAQYFGVAQRRRRVFFVRDTGDWFRREPLFLVPDCLSGNPPPSREKGKGTAHELASCIGASGRGFERVGETRGQDQVVVCPLTGNPYGDHESRESLLVAHSLRAEGFDASEDGTGRGTPLVPVGIARESGQGWWQEDEIAGSLDANMGMSGHANRAAIVAFSAKDHGADAMEDCSPTLRAGGHTGSHANAGVMPAVCMPILEAGARTGKSTDDPRAGMGVGESGDPMFTLQSGKQHAVAFAENQRGEIRTSDISPQLSCAGGKPGSGYPAVAMNLRGRDGGAMPECDDVASLRAASGGSSRSYIAQMAVRRLTPRECARLQGFPDDYLDIDYRGKPAADGVKYKALGNSMAVPVMKWIGERIAIVDKM